MAASIPGIREVKYNVHPTQASEQQETAATYAVHSSPAHWQQVCERVNRASNYFMETEGVDYIRPLSRISIVEEDMQNFADLAVFPELAQCGYDAEAKPCLILPI
jgi:hypothetical protein